MRKIILALAGGLFLVTCSSQPPQQHSGYSMPELTTHLQDSENKPEHDEVSIANGIQVDFYPNRNFPRRINYRFPQGGFIDATCTHISNPCSEWTLRITGFRPGHMPEGFNIDLPEGTYLLLPTDDPKLMTIKNAESEQTIGYWVTTKTFVHLVSSYQQARAMEDPQ